MRYVVTDSCGKIWLKNPVTLEPWRFDTLAEARGFLVLSAPGRQGNFQIKKEHEK